MSSLHVLGLAYESNGESSDEGDNCSASNDIPQKITKLPLPQAFVSAIKDPLDVPNDVSKHQGRTRSFAHERGNWATFVCLPYPVEQVTEFKSCIEMAVRPDQGIHDDIQWSIVKDFHLSISKTVAIPHHFIEPFVESLREKCSNYQTFMVQLCSSELHCFVNDDKTRSFLGFQVSAVDTTSHIKRLVHSVDEIMLDFRCATYYENPSFHISVAWCLGDVTEHQYNDILLEKIKEKLIVFESECENLFLLEVSEILLKTGNKIFSFPLSR